MHAIRRLLGLADDAGEGTILHAIDCLHTQLGGQRDALATLRVQLAELEARWNRERPGQCPEHGWYLRACPECEVSRRELDAEDEARKQKVKAECYGRKLHLLIHALDQAGYSLPHIGIGQGYEEQMVSLRDSINRLRARLAELEETAVVWSEMVEANPDLARDGPGNWRGYYADWKEVIGSFPVDIVVAGYCQCPLELSTMLTDSRDEWKQRAEKADAANALLSMCVSNIAMQHLPEELEDDEARDNADFDGAYEEIVREARKAATEAAAVLSSGATP